MERLGGDGTNTPFGTVRVKSPSFQSILVCSPSWIGDAVMCLGALRSLRKHFGRARMTILAKPSVEELFRSCDAVDATLLYDPTTLHGGPLGLLRMARTLRRAHFDLAVLFPNAFRAAAVVWAGGIPERWGYGTDGRNLLLTRSVPPPPRPFGRHQTFYYLDLVQELGAPVEPPDIHLELTASMAERGRNLLVSRGWSPGQSLLGLHPGATNSRAKRWLPERFAEVGDRLAGAQEARVVLLAGPAEASLAEDIGSRMQSGPLILAGQTSLGELMGVLGLLKVLVTNDSGPMHLASALGVPTVAVFGPTDERETGPLGRESRVVRKQVDCSPCLLSQCPLDHRCMERVGVEEVFAVASSLLEEREVTRVAEAQSL